MTSLDVAIVGMVQIRYHTKERREMTAVTYQKFVQNNCDNLDASWKTFILCVSPRPGLSGMMQFVHHGGHPGKASVMFLPMIDTNSSDTTCIYSTLICVTEHARRQRDHRLRSVPLVEGSQDHPLRAFSE